MAILKIFYYKIPSLNSLQWREGIFIETENGWGEAAPLPGYSQENLNAVLEQLRMIQDGSSPPLYPSLAFALFPCVQKPISWPASALLMGKAKDIFKRAERLQGFTSAKLKVGNLTLEEAIFVTRELKGHFRLRIDCGQKWTLKEAEFFCSHFTPTDFDYLEDPLKNPSELSQLSFPIGLDFSNAPFTPKAHIHKPTLRGIPKPSSTLVLSSSFESDLGLGRLVQLAKALQLPPHPIGIGTYHYLSHHLLEEPLIFSRGEVHVPILKPNLKSPYVREL